MKGKRFNRRGLTSFYVLMTFVLIIFLFSSFSALMFTLNKSNKTLQEKSDYNNFLNTMVMKAKNYDLVSLEQPIKLTSVHNGEEHTIEFKRGSDVTKEIVTDEYKIDWVEDTSLGDTIYKISDVKVNTNSRKDSLVYLDFLGNTDDKDESTEQTSNLLPQGIINHGNDELNLKHFIPNTVNKLLSKSESKTKYGKEYSYIRVYTNGREDVKIIKDNPETLTDITTNLGEFIVIEYMSDNHDIIAWSRHVSGQQNVLDYGSSKGILVSSLPKDESVPYTYSKDQISGNYKKELDPILGYGKTNSLYIGDLTSRFCRYEQVKNPFSSDADAGQAKSESKYVGYLGSPCDPSRSDYISPQVEVVDISDPDTTRSKGLNFKADGVSSYINGINNINPEFLETIKNFKTTPILDKDHHYMDRLYCASDVVTSYISAYIQAKGVINPNHYLGIYPDYSPEAYSYIQEFKASGNSDFLSYLTSNPPPSSTDDYFSPYADLTYVTAYSNYYKSVVDTDAKEFNEWFKEVTNNGNIGIPCLGGKDYNSVYMRYTNYFKESKSINLNLINNLDSDYTIDIVYSKVDSTSKASISKYEYRGNDNFNIDTHEDDTSSPTQTDKTHTYSHFLTKNVSYLSKENSLTDLEVGRSIYPQGFKFTTTNAIIKSIKVSYETITDLGVVYEIKNSKGEIVKEGSLTFD